MSTGIILRPYQNKLANDLRRSFAVGKKKPLAVSPTGSGKTVMFSYITKGATDKGLNVLILAHRQELLFQISETLELFKCKHGFIMPGQNIDTKLNVQVGSVFTVIKRLTKIKTPDLIIIDESQHCAKGNTWSTVLNNYPNAKVIGVTATPVRLDGKPLGDIFDDLVLGPSVKELIDIGALSDYVAYAPALVETEGLKISMGDYKKDDIEIIMNKPSITGSAVKEWLKIARNKKTIVFCTSVNHARNVADEYKMAGISAEYAHGAMDNIERKKILSNFKSGKVQVLTNVNLFTEGFDVKTIDCVQLLRPTASLGLYLQMVGRGLRVYDGKGKALILDHVKAIEKHGLPDDDREWSLTEKIKKRKSKDGKTESPVKVCSTCFAANNAFNSYCIICGSPFEVKARTGPEEIDGELKEVNRMELKRQQKIEQAKAKTLEDLIAVGVKRNMKYPRQWASHILKARNRR